MPRPGCSPLKVSWGSVVAAESSPAPREEERLSTSEWSCDPPVNAPVEKLNLESAASSSPRSALQADARSSGIAAAAVPTPLSSAVEERTGCFAALWEELRAVHDREVETLRMEVTCLRSKLEIGEPNLGCAGSGTAQQCEDQAIWPDEKTSTGPASAAAGKPTEDAAPIRYAFGSNGVASLHRASTAPCIIEPAVEGGDPPTLPTFMCGGVVLGAHRSQTPPQGIAPTVPEVSEDTGGAIAEIESDDFACEKKKRPGSVPENQTSPTTARATDQAPKSLLSFVVEKTTSVVDVESSFHSLRSLVKNPVFEMVFCIFIGINALVIAAQVQYDGLGIGYTIQYPLCSEPASDLWPRADTIFHVLDWFFGVLFTAEIVMRLVGLQREFWTEVWNFLDLSVVCLWIVEVVGTTNVIIPIDAKVIRLARSSRVLRMVRLVRQVQAFESLYVMATAIKASGVVLGWACLLLFIVQMMLGLMMNHVLYFTYFNDANKPREEQQAVYEYFGSFTRAMLSMFEITLGNWPPVCRVVGEFVSEWYVIFFIAHKLLIGFAVVGVINAVFIQETFSVASTDDRIMMNQKERQIQSHIKKMRRLFEHSDTTGDGVIDREEWRSVCQDETVALWLSAMGVDGIDNCDNVFNIIDKDNDGALSIEEMIRGLARLKGQARSADLLTLLKEFREHQKTVLTMQTGFVSIAKANTSTGLKQTDAFRAESKGSDLFSSFCCDSKEGSQGGSRERRMFGPPLLNLGNSAITNRLSSHPSANRKRSR